MAVQVPLSNKYDSFGGVNPRSASGAITSSETGTAFAFAGEGHCTVNVSALDIVSNDEHYGFVIRANTKAATSTWSDLAWFDLGALEVSGLGVDGVVGRYDLHFVNKNDHQVRLDVVVAGTSPSITFTAEVLPKNETI